MRRADDSGGCVVATAVSSLRWYMDMVVPGNGGSVCGGIIGLTVGEGVVAMSDCSGLWLKCDGVVAT